ncbi:MAG: low molecular weight phosphotyrosine protein phosphatase [Pseudomonadota bacterium]
MTVCVGNMCRSPIAEAALKERLPKLRIASAGLEAPRGSRADATAAEAAFAAGLDLKDHRATRFDPADASTYDLILVMENAHKLRISEIAPQLSGRTMLMTHWTGGHEIPDPYRLPIEEHEKAISELLPAADAWAKKIS